MNLIIFLLMSVLAILLEMVSSETGEPSGDFGLLFFPTVFGSVFIGAGLIYLAHKSDRVTQLARTFSGRAAALIVVYGAFWLFLTYNHLLAFWAAIAYMFGKAVTLLGIFIGHHYQMSGDHDPRTHSLAGAKTYYSNWWYGIAIPPLLDLVGTGFIKLTQSAGLLREGASVLYVLIPFVTILLSTILIPVFAFSLFLDARKLAAADAPWNPNPYVWGGAGLLSLLGLVIGLNVFKLPIALIYLYYRNKHVGLF